MQIPSVFDVDQNLKKSCDAHTNYHIAYFNKPWKNIKHPWRFLVEAVACRLLYVRLHFNIILHEVPLDDRILLSRGLVFWKTWTCSASNSAVSVRVSWSNGALGFMHVVTACISAYSCIDSHFSHYWAMERLPALLTLPTRFHWKPRKI